MQPRRLKPKPAGCALREAKAPLFHGAADVFVAVGVAINIERGGHKSTCPHRRKVRQEILLFRGNARLWARSKWVMGKRIQFRKTLIIGMVAALWLSLALSARAEPDAVASTALERGFLGLYNLDFTGAQKDFRLGNSSIRKILWGR